MIDHVSIQVSELGSRAQFYAAVLTPLGLRQLVTEENTVGFGKRYPEFWLNLRAGRPGGGTDPGAHVAIRAPSVKAVEDFHRLALIYGGRSDGAPGEWQGAMADYFGAFIVDLDGNRIEALHFTKPLAATSG